MIPDNKFIAAQFQLLAKLMDIHGENSFKIKSYSNAAAVIDKLPAQLSTMQRPAIFTIKSIGEAIGKKIFDILDTGGLPQLNEWLAKTPPGIVEMLKIKGIGPKKIITIWKEMEIETIGELLYACNENRLTLYKGFGEKTQNSILAAIEFYQQHQGIYLYSDAERIVLNIEAAFRNNFKQELLAATGDFRKQEAVISRLEWLTTLSVEQLDTFMRSIEGIEKTMVPEHTDLVHYKTTEGFPLEFSLVKSEDFQAAVNSIPSPALTPGVIQTADIKGIIHSHSNWSDGSNTIEEMARACIDKGFEYLVISDHSKSAQYAKGLYPERVKEQHLHIDELNTRLAPFKIFKSIESDILSDGSLDYSDKVLESFDLVIASIHSNLKMDEEKAMRRLLRAIENPYTTILGHLSGRLLLSRSGYPVDHKKIIDACAKHNVVIELNAHPRRLDIDQTWIPYMMEKDVLISIDPDAHNINGLNDIRYGVLAAQKGGLTKEKNLSSFSRKELEDFIHKKQ